MQVRILVKEADGLTELVKTDEFDELRERTSKLTAEYDNITCANIQVPNGNALHSMCECLPIQQVTGHAVEIYK